MYPFEAVSVMFTDYNMLETVSAERDLYSAYIIKFLGQAIEMQRLHG